MMVRKLAVASLCALSLVACSSNNEERFGLPKTIATSLKTAIASRRAGKRPVVQVTPQMLADTKIAAIQVNPEKAGGSDFLRRIASRRDSRNRVNEVWQSSDNAQIFLRNGVLVGTRGVGTDIISSTASETISALQSGQSVGSTRSYNISNGDNTAERADFRCSVNNLGPADIIIVNQSFRTSHFRESCLGGPSGEVSITNDYWVLPGSGTVKKSRQWAGPASGYFEIILLKK